MPTAAFALLVATALVAQNTPPELKRASRSIEPTLPEAMRPVVTRAADAELDPKRGTGNAVQILRDEKRKYDGRPLLVMALDLRIAAAVIRAQFINNGKVGEGERYQQAVSTFSKLELSEPGLATWVDRMLGKNPAAKGKVMGKPGAAPIKIGMLVRGGGLDRGEVFQQIKRRFGDAGFDVKKAAVANADFVFKLAADEVREGDQGTVVRVTLDVEHVEDGKTAWRKDFYRTSRAPSVRVAIDANVDWLIRVGGRDVLFRTLTEAGLESAIMRPMGGAHGEHGGHGGHGGHGSPPRVTLPARGKTEPPAPKARK